jgi:hypothetical protein
VEARRLQEVHRSMEVVEEAGQRRVLGAPLFLEGPGVALELQERLQGGEAARRVPGPAEASASLLSRPNDRER